MTHRTQRGNLLIADPDLIDPNFFHAVVLILEHDEEGALGLVLNRPTCVSAAQMVPEWKSRVSNPMNIFQGGPIPSKMLLEFLLSAFTQAIPGGLQVSLIQK